MTRAALAHTSELLLATWIALPLLLWATLRVVTQLFDHYLALGDKLEELAVRDPLTGLANRRHFQALFALAAERRRRTGEPLAMLMADIDFFKRVNDRWGHASGDRVLARVAGMLGEHLRANDEAARLGGEEFAMLLPGASLAAALAMAERLRLAIAACAVDPAPDAPASAASPADHGDGRIHVTISIGAAEAGADGLASLDDMLAAADRRLYAAKAGGRNCVVGTDGTYDAAAPVSAP